MIVSSSRQPLARASAVSLTMLGTENVNICGIALTPLSKGDHFLVGGLLADIEQRSAHDFVGVLVDPRAVRALDHCDRRIVKRSNNADRHGSGELARDA